ncbi:hypothetical protein N7457_001720 [Penicillium paradoxum]|uniref:uncharacterized protein n=1 Tax=Penicillium paradoxum TaxID=176176 RepID=UPI0025478477|nr:uncharacterized protein N7457_001720 [Penicillium paradoxum]KAJ5795121.1 hypothetical protein N7457_001720 [Penicillium paradoxum]
MADDHSWKSPHPVYNVPLAVLQATKQPTIYCDVHQVDNLAPLSWAVEVSTWINTNHFLWSLCAGLADSGTDKDWTGTFNAQYRLVWEEIQARVQEVDGEYKFGILIPEPPVQDAMVIHRPGNPMQQTWKLRSHPRHVHATPQVTSYSWSGLWRFLRFVTENQSTVSGRFEVVLSIPSMPKDPQACLLLAMNQRDGRNV